jgi:tetratricopeptide (TPR) repeat protein
LQRSGAQSGLTATPHDVALRRRKVQILFRQRKYELAQDSLEGLQLDADLRWLRGRILYERKRFAEAAGALRDCLTAGDDWAEVHHDLVVSLARGGRKPDAQEALDRALARHPQDSQLIELRQRLP